MRGVKDDFWGFGLLQERKGGLVLLYGCGGAGRDQG